MSGTDPTSASLAAQIADLRTTVDSNVLQGLAADEAGVTVLAATLAQVVSVLEALDARATALEAAEARRMAASLRLTLHLPA